MTRIVIGVDVGGTYTDLFLFDEATGQPRVHKVPSTRGHEATGLARGIEALSPLPGISAIVHGTTVGTNALLERKGAPAGLITTAGFKDVLAMRRRDRRQTWGLTGHFVPPIPRQPPHRGRRTHPRRRHHPHPHRPRRGRPGRPPFAA